MSQHLSRVSKATNESEVSRRPVLWGWLFIAMQSKLLKSASLIWAKIEGVLSHLLVRVLPD